MTVTIIANDDDTVTVEAPGLRVHIAHDDGWAKANGVAHMLSAVLREERDLKRIRRHARHILDSIRELQEDAHRAQRLVDGGEP